MLYRRTSRANTVVWTLVAVFIMVVGVGVLGHTLNWFDSNPDSSDPCITAPNTIDLLDEPLVLLEAGEEVESILSFMVQVGELLNEVFEGIELEFTDDVFIDMNIYDKILGRVTNVRAFSVPFTEDGNKALIFTGICFFHSHVFGIYFVLEVVDDYLEEGIMFIVGGNINRHELTPVGLTINQMTIHIGGFRA